MVSGFKFWFHEISHFCFEGEEGDMDEDDEEGEDEDDNDKDDD